ncbi:F-box/kelch-repeat protein At2g43270-like [Bidens hawaiensis]|uniref:F-box/kelch-repeat protein At2g43270-like n=1 Tax=Bidens hawaiensis TaxID=980011 RepID=UPI00404A8A88
MAEVVFDVVEQILVRLDVKDLIRYKSVCKSWLSVISSPRFIKAHLNHNIKSDRNNCQLGCRRIFRDKIRMEDQWASCDFFPSIVGSCNGLLCFFSHGDTDMLLVTNPATREEKKLQTPPNLSRKDMIR